VNTIAICCMGMPVYSARQFRRVIEEYPGSVHVVATRPDVPIRGMEEELGQKVHWIDGAEKTLRWHDLGLSVPDFLLQGGYALPAFGALEREVGELGGKVALGSDVNWQGGLRQRLIDPLRHRLLLGKRFDAVFVPGKSGARYSRAMGYGAGRIATGLYGADPLLFPAGPPLETRQKKILYAGQFIERKNVLGLARAFIAFFNRHPDWHLEMCGSGPQRAAIPDHPAITVRDFAQPAQLSQMMRQARALILPSRQEHWGVVVHEAALSGCALLLSNAVGATDDLASPENAILFAPGSDREIEQALARFARFDDFRLRRAQAQSLKLAAGFGPHRFAAELRGLIAELAGPRRKGPLG
jgi:glycosyltransferase involved in cell wall biosynthesis